MAAITGAIVLAILIPILLIIAFIAYTLFKKFSNDGSSWSYKAAPPMRSNSRLRLNETRATSPPISDEDFSPRSPVPSDTSSSSSKKRRSYDKVYRTHEPLEGLPEVNFEEKPFDPNELEYEPDSKPSLSPKSDIYTEPFQTSRPDLVRFQSNPNLGNNSRLTYTSDDYALPMKDHKQRMSSQSSIITDVWKTFCNSSLACGIKLWQDYYIFMNCSGCVIMFFFLIKRANVRLGMSKWSISHVRGVIGIRDCSIFLSLYCGMGLLLYFFILPPKKTRIAINYNVILI